MSRFREMDLFGSGPHEFVDQGCKRRTQLAPGIGSDRVGLVDHGREARVIEQRGLLIADTPDGLSRRAEAIEQAMHGEPATLSDDLGQNWRHVVLVAFVRREFRPIGRRWSCNYEATYVQVNP